MNPNDSHPMKLFERLGRLRCRFAEPAGNLLPSRWPLRTALQTLHSL
jgi:hypothetical protein